MLLDEIRKCSQRLEILGSLIKVAQNFGDDDFTGISYESQDVEGNVIPYEEMKYKDTPHFDRLPVYLPNDEWELTRASNLIDSMYLGSNDWISSSSNQLYSPMETTIDSFMDAMGAQESGGNYNLTNPDSDAYGKYQIMPFNWPIWAVDAGLEADAEQTPENQEIVARYKMLEYHDTYGNWEDVATAWYGGPGAVSRGLYTGPDTPNANDSSGYPTVTTYVNQIRGRVIE